VSGTGSVTRPGTRPGTRKDRRSRRVPAAHRLLLTIFGPTGAEITKEIVSTVELSQFGARVRGRRVLGPQSEATLTQLSSGRQARVRIAWQQKSESHPGYLDSGVELLSGFDYWGISFEEPAPPAARVAPADAKAATGTQAARGPAAKQLTASELLAELSADSAADPDARVLEAIWCGLIDQLEGQRLLSRADLVASIRAIAGARTQSPKN
jgi:hypothetical protein